mmetsp:Transcript_5128/g.9850  ORF Transcript_5128/g.9850 Transcript_5128/m.9850 type:complete len:190 (-) Transcript_5128:160-729(-)
MNTPQEEQQQHQSRGEISARTEQIQSALEVQIRRLFERFDCSNRNRRQQRQQQSQEVDDVAVAVAVSDRGNLRGGGVGKWKRHLSPLGDLLGLIRVAAIAVMNAAVAIFGVGVGVGLILGDSFRGGSQRAEHDLLEEDGDAGSSNSRSRRRVRSRGSRRVEATDDGGTGGHVDGASTDERPSLSSLPAQ